VSEYTAMRTEALALRDWIFTNIPRDPGTGAVLISTVDEGGNEVPLVVTSGQSATFRAQADAFIATIG